MMTMQVTYIAFNRSDGWLKRETTDAISADCSFPKRLDLDQISVSLNNFYILKEPLLNEITVKYTTFQSISLKFSFNSPLCNDAKTAFDAFKGSFKSTDWTEIWNRFISYSCSSKYIQPITECYECVMEMSFS